MLPLGGAVREVEVVPGVKGLVKAEWQACFFFCGRHVINLSSLKIRKARVQTKVSIRVAIQLGVPLCKKIHLDILDHFPIGRTSPCYGQQMLFFW